MFSFFKRRPSGAPSEGGGSFVTAGMQSQSTAKASAKASALRWQEPIPVPEAQDADWSMWEDSVAFQDSQIKEYEPTEPAPLARTDLADAPAPDPFSVVHKHSG